MDDFDCYGPDLEYRRGAFPDGTIGAAELDRLMQRLPTLRWESSPEDPLVPLRRLHTQRVARPLPCPRIFISHRLADVDPALRVAYLACTLGFRYWLDVLDAPVAPLARAGADPYQHAVATAALIEIALLNCTHVLALITDHTAGSTWVPYEYGRVKDFVLMRVKAAAWFHPNQTRSVAEYMHLGVNHRSDAAVAGWLRAELTAWHMGRGWAPPCAGRPWPRATVPPPLPEQATTESDAECASVSSGRLTFADDV